MNREEVLKILKSHEDKLKKLGVISLELFGSVARNEAYSDRDVSLFQFIELVKPLVMAIDFG